MNENNEPLMKLGVLFDIENENGINYNARNCSIRYNGLLYYEKPSAKSIPAWYEMVGRVGRYRFYVPVDPRAEGWLDNNAGYFVQEDN